MYLDGIECLITLIYGQNTSNMNLYNKNMTTLVKFLKDSLPKTEVQGDGTLKTTASTSSLVGGAKMAKLMKPAKVPTWTKDLTLETYTKQLLTWSDILEDIPE